MYNYYFWSILIVRFNFFLSAVCRPKDMVNKSKARSLYKSKKNKQAARSYVEHG